MALGLVWVGRNNRVQAETGPEDDSGPFVLVLPGREDQTARRMVSW
jgi:hypothetical protein